MTTTLGLILAGGQARRWGGQDKALIKLGGQSLLQHVLARLGPQVDRLALSSNRLALDYTQFCQGSAWGDIPVIADQQPGYLGPLAGILTALQTWPEAQVVSVAVDLPLLPTDLVTRLKQAADQAVCSYASDGHQHALAIRWAPGLAPALATYMDNGGRSVRDWLRDHAAPVVFDRAQDLGLFVNLNTPQDLARAEQDFFNPQGNSHEPT